MRKVMKASVLGLLLSLTVFTWGAQAAPVSIDFWNLFSGPDGRWMAEMVDEFNATHDDINVKMQVLPWGEPYYSKLATSILVGGAPDIAVAHDWSLARYAAVGDLIEVTPKFLEKTQVSRNDYLEKPWEAAIYQGRQYGIPLDAHPYGMYYNKGLFSASGLDPNAPPSDAVTFEEAARKLTRDTDGDGRADVFGVAPSTGRHPVRIWYALFNQMGGELLSPDRRSSAFLEKGAEALEYLLSIYHDPAMSSTQATDTGLAFRTGTLGMHFNGPWMITSFEEQEGLNFGAAPVPQFFNDPGTWTASHILIFPKQKGSEPEKLDATQEFVRWLSANSLAWAKAGQVPARVSVIGSQDFRSLEHQPVFASQLGYVQYWPNVLPILEVLSRLDSALERAILGQASAQEAMREAARRVDEVLMKNQ